jgi:hypothetical protein
MVRWTGWAPDAGESAHWCGATSWLADGLRHCLGPVGALHGDFVPRQDSTADANLAARWSEFDGYQVLGGPGNEPGASRLMRWRCFSHVEVRAKPRKGAVRFDPDASMLRWHL